MLYPHVLLCHTAQKLCQARPASSRDLRLAIGFGLWLIVSLALPGQAAGYVLYGYEDTYGIVHLSETKLDDKHILLYQGETRPKLGFEAIRKLIRQKGGIEGPRDEIWFRKNVLRGSLRRGAGASAGRGATVRDPGTVDREILACIKRTSARFRLDPQLIYAVIEQESNFEPLAVSHKGAEGLMQLTPEAQRYFGLENPFQAEKNIEAGARYLRFLLDKFTSLHLALAAYNAGPATVERYRDIPPYPETQQYVERVMQRYTYLKNL